MMPCFYAHRAEEAYRQDECGDWVKVKGPVLCGWADDGAPEALVGLPRWLQRAALAGHLLKWPEDCVGCPCYKPGGKID